MRKAINVSDAGEVATLLEAEQMKVSGKTITLERMAETIALVLASSVALARMIEELQAEVL